MNTIDSEVEQRLAKAREVIKMSANADKRKKAKAALTLLSATDQVGASIAYKLIRLFDDIMK